MSDNGHETSEMTSVRSTEADVKELMGLFDAPAFARRGRDMEWSIQRTLTLSGKKRLEMLDMVHCRLRMWSNCLTGPNDWQLAFTGPIDYIWALSEAPEPIWKGKVRPTRKVAIALGTSIVQSIERFNTRWVKWLSQLELDTINRQIDHYNKYYLLEKECIVGSSRLASRLYKPVAVIDKDWLIMQFPILAVPDLI
ncbi:MAG: hypothetical protein DWH73_00895 [Planctomycetota bacterium]|nr:MAG: hypothetical protein DWH73_00895 [Planctomycetota bacterium]